MNEGAVSMGNRIAAVFIFLGIVTKEIMEWAVSRRDNHNPRLTSLIARPFQSMDGLCCGQAC